MDLCIEDRNYTLKVISIQLKYGNIMNSNHGNDGTQPNKDRKFFKMHPVNDHLFTLLLSMIFPKKIINN